MKGKRAPQDKSQAALRQAVTGLMESGKYQEALKKIQSRLLFGPKDIWLIVEAARCCRRLDRKDDAARYYTQALSIAPNDAGALNGLGLIHYERGNNEEAEKYYRRALRAIANYPACRNNYGILLHKLDRFEEAVEQYEAVLAEAPNYHDARYGLASVFAQIKRFDEAEAHLRYLLAHQPEDTRSSTVLGMILIQRGRYEEGWKLYRDRYAQNNIYRFVNRPAFSFPYWQGEDLHGKTIMVHREQGLGDEIQFSRYVSRLKQEKGAAAVCLVCSRALVSLMRQLPGIDNVIEYAPGKPLPVFDYWIMLLDLPFYFTDSPTPFAMTPPCFSADPQAVARWPLPPGKLRVGLVWKGSVGHNKDRFRSLPGLETLRPLFSVPGIQWVSLQKGAGEEEALNPPSGIALLALGHLVQDYIDTAAIIAQLDLVISVDTSVAHLAGALNKPCWTLVSAICTDWRWLEGQDTTPWYPSMRLLRCDPKEGWTLPVLRMRDALMSMVE
ncbi:MULTISPECIES: tetratricopeptide repeat protein [Tenebrionibacter/Tenebrionicola group]|jgi:Flp pilus assembly protein TadD|uniref:Tetratricopeptide repeat protein n=2 Tax=Tenebrionibacter/Tenebrionicola group TaxID=2969848 RepID=A0A8K0V5M9_9ENTR|nr:MULTISPECIES: tetratricopeptide repeat protein [Tenebrionibacter/Tenebrionicola group]MBK4715565.1 tetratricopeptide repeat protein [Tenebrionibacter intestinalis]MBV5095808.1 tetratricopeptide repeat protein [Tenebrionicola larvae]